MQPNLARLDLVSLRLVHLCAELGSLSAAAEAAHLSLSGASGRLARLENAYGHKLFLRQARGLEPTVQGRVLAHHVRRLLDQLDEMNRCVARADESTASAGVRKGPAHSRLSG